MSTKIEDGGPAFPVPEFASGMSLRDWLAGKVFAAAASESAHLDVSGTADQAVIDAALKSHWDGVARAAYIAADAMLAARTREPRP